MEKRYVPGADYVEPKKSSRRKPKGTHKDESSQAESSSTVPSPSTAQSSYGQGPSIPKPPTSRGVTQTPAPTDARQTTQTSSQSVPATLSVKPTHALGHRASASQDTNDGGSVATLAAAQMNPTVPLPHQGQAGRDDSKSIPSTGALPTASAGSSKDKHLTSGLNDKAQIAQGNSKLIHIDRPSRPGYGTKGFQVEMFTNYFSLKIARGLVLHRYSITVLPDLKGKRLAQIIDNALGLRQFDALRPGIATDFSAFLVSREKLTQDHLNVSVPMATGLNADDLRRAKKYAVWFSFVSTFDFSQLNITQASLADQESLPVVQDLDIVLGHHRKSSQDVASVGKRKAFSMRPAAQQVSLGGVLKALQGFFSSVHFCEKGPLVNINVSNSPFWKEGSLVDVVRTLQTDSEIDNTKISALLRGVQVQLTCVKDRTVLRTISGYATPDDGNEYMPHPPRVPRNVDGPGPQDVLFFWEKNPRNDKDEKESEEGKVKPHRQGCSCDGEYISVAKYFADKYQIQCDHSDNELPVINIGNANHPTYVPLKVCSVLEQASKMKLSQSDTKTMQKFAVRTPDKNANDILNRGFQTLGLLSGNQILNNFGLRVEQDLVTVRGRVLYSPTPTYHKNESREVRQRSKWDLAGIKFMDGKPLEKWSCLNIHYGSKLDEDPTSWVKAFVKELNKCGIRCTQPAIDNVKLGSINTEPDGKSELADWFNYFRDPRKGIRFLLVILPNKLTDLYNHIKRLGDQDFGILTCCVVARKEKFFSPVSQFAVQYNANVALKVNLKLGGANHVLREGQFLKVEELEGKTMVIGIDVTHPSVGSSDHAPSIAAMVSSDKRLAQWPADLRINTSREEMVEKLQSMLESRLRWWKRVYNDLPENILIYRDGVSEGQYQAVLDEEMPQIRKACVTIYGDTYAPVIHPRISLIVVGKRHHTRFIGKTRKGGSINSANGGKASNPEPGTVVDNTITYKMHNWDFFLQSHKPIMGTARPAHYFVLVDEIFRRWTTATIPPPFKNPADILEQVTHNMCFLFGRATLSVSIPPPVYYADIACERGRCYLSRFYDPKARKRDTSGITDQDVGVHEELKDTMFYI